MKESESDFLKIEESESEVLKIEASDSETELLCTDSTAQVAACGGRILCACMEERNK
jgi:hypothetical protein